jgi:phenylacetate-CoA ligase
MGGLGVSRILPPQYLAQATVWIESSEVRTTGCGRVGGSADVIGTAHELLARGLLLPLYRLQRTLRPARRAAMRHLREGKRFRSEAIAWSVDQKADWILKQIRAVVRYANRHTTYYRELFAGIGFDPEADFGWETFARLPVLDRATVQRAGEDLRATSLPIDAMRRDATGGSTGTPTEIWIGPQESGWRESGVMHYMARIGVPSGCRTALLWGHHLDPVASDGLKERALAFVEHVRWFDCFRLSAAQLARYHAELEQWRPRCLIAYASALGALAGVAQRHGSRPGYPTHCFVTGAEKLMPSHRKLIEQVYGRPVHERYGSRDVGLIGFQMDVEGSREFEIDWANVFVEPETTDADAPILVTKLHGDGMPMLRYRIDDAARFPPGSRPGQPTLRLPEVRGRTSDRIWLPNGGWIDGIEFPHLMKDHPVAEFQIFQHADLRVTVRVVPARGFTAHSQSVILQIVRANLPGLDVRVELVEHIARTKANKWRPVLTEAAPLGEGRGS